MARDVGGNLKDRMLGRSGWLREQVGGDRDGSKCRAFLNELRRRKLYRDEPPYRRHYWSPAERKLTLVTEPDMGTLFPLLAQAN